MLLNMMLYGLTLLVCGFTLSYITYSILYTYTKEKYYNFMRLSQKKRENAFAQTEKEHSGLSMLMMCFIFSSCVGSVLVIISTIGLILGL